MDEKEFLASYDPKAFTPVAVAVDVVIIGVVERKLSVFIPERDQQPQRGKHGLPGSFLRPDEDLDDCAARTVREKAGGVNVTLRQFQAFSALKRDPRLRVVSVGYLALATADVLRLLPANSAGAQEIGTITTGEAISVFNDVPERLDLAFDHNQIVTAAVRRLQFDLGRTDDVFRFLPDEFTLFDLQLVHEAIRGRVVNKPAFRKTILTSGRLEPTGRRDTRSPGRPAELYRLREGSR